MLEYFEKSVVSNAGEYSYFGLKWTQEVQNGGKGALST
jgi:hypothetical protein